MAYFNELPNVEVVARFPNQATNQDYVTIKNLWRRAKLREDIANAITAFNYYQIQGNERPDQIAQKFYNDPELDWVVLITNNIININEEWPLEGETFYKYLIEKYGSDEELQKIHHTETIEQKDRFNRLVVPEGLQVDPSFKKPTSFNTVLNKETYQLDGFPSSDGLTKVSVNLIQTLNVKQRDLEDVLYFITDIQIETSFLKVLQRSSTNLDITINNDLFDNWPASWGGQIPILKRTGLENFNVEDIINSNFSINIPERLYEVVGKLVAGKIVPFFQFRYIAPS